MSKWIVIDADNSGDTLECEIFDTYEQAYDYMVNDVNFVKEDCDDVSISKDCANVQSDFHCWIWRICEVKC